MPFGPRDAHGFSDAHDESLSARDAMRANSVGAWLAALQPPPPPALARRLSDLLSPYLAEPSSRVPDVCLEVGERLLDSLLASGSTSRGTALDLLAADALVTYAFQAAADVPAELEAKAARAMAVIAALPDARRE